MRSTAVIALMLLGKTTAMAVELESPDRVDPLFDCSAPMLDADTPERAKLVRVQYGGDALVRELRQTYASRLAGLFWDQQEGADSRLVLRLTGRRACRDAQALPCSKRLTIEFIAGQMHTSQELQRLHADNLAWFRGRFPGLQGHLRGRTLWSDRAGDLHPGSRGHGCRGAAAGSSVPVGRSVAHRHDPNQTRADDPQSRE